MQEEVEQRTISVSIQAAKLTGRVLKDALVVVLRKMEEGRTTPKVGRNDLKKLMGKDGGAENIEVTGRIRSFERYARKHKVRYSIEKTGVRHLLSGRSISKRTRQRHCRRHLKNIRRKT